MSDETPPRKSSVERRISQLLPRAEAGDLEAQYQVGLAYNQGFVDAPLDPEWETRAGAWFAKAAAKGHARAQFELATCYDTGRCGLKSDPAQAFAWFEKAANLKNCSAEFAIGQAYYFGIRSVKKDLVKAKLWLERAARNGHPSARELLTHLHE